MRNAGCWLTWNEKPREFTGTLSSTTAGKDEIGMMASIFISDGPKLFDPRVKSVFGNELRIVGVEKVNSAWVLQEWNCEILEAK